MNQRAHLKKKVNAMKALCDLSTSTESRWSVEIGVSAESSLLPEQFFPRHPDAA
jgi:hypothetical protein